MEISTVLVTGCAGFIGSNFVRQFKEIFPHVQIIGIDDLSSGRRDAVDESTTFYCGSILDEELVYDIFERHKPDCVFHFAAVPRVSYSVQYPIYTSEVNIVGTVTLLEAAKRYGAKRFVFSSSSAIYGDAQEMPTKESGNPPAPVSPYALQKSAGEQFCKMFSELFGLDTICLRYFNVYGPGQYGDASYSTVVCAWLESAYFPEKGRAFLEGDGTQSRDFCYVDDIVRANILAMQSEKEFKGECINIASGETLEVNRVRSCIESVVGRQLDIELRPPRSGDVRSTHADITSARSLIGYEPMTSFEEGIGATVGWFKSRL